MSEKSVIHALSAVTNAELRYFRLVQCNIRNEYTRTELDTYYYMCLGKHSFFILDRNMIADPNIDETGLLVKIPYTAIEYIRQREKEKDSELFLISMFRRARITPAKLLIRTSARDQLLNQLMVCWKTDFMYQHWRVANFPLEEGDIALPPPAMGSDYPESWNYDGQQEGRDFSVSPVHPRF